MWNRSVHLLLFFLPSFPFVKTRFGSVQFIDTSMTRDETMYFLELEVEVFPSLPQLWSSNNRFHVNFYY